jgi:hypothetical protein
VSSLDDTRRAYIAERLVTEAKHRQVIVFTHDIPFLIDLTDQAETNSIVPLVQGVWRNAMAQASLRNTGIAVVSVDQALQMRAACRGRFGSLNGGSGLNDASPHPP